MHAPTRNVCLHSNLISICVHLHFPLCHTNRPERRPAARRGGGGAQQPEPNVSRIFMPLYTFKTPLQPQIPPLLLTLFSSHSQADWATEMPSLWSTPGAPHNAPPEQSGIPSPWRSPAGLVIGYQLIKQPAQFGAFGGAHYRTENNKVWMGEGASTERERERGGNQRRAG